MVPRQLDCFRSQRRLESSAKPLRAGNSRRITPLGEDSLPLKSLELYAGCYLEDCESAGQSPDTVSGKSLVIKNLLWFLKREGRAGCGESELRRFMIYLQKGHLEPKGRWGNPRYKQSVGQRTLNLYHVYLAGLFGWVVWRGVLAYSPMDYLTKPQAAAPPPIDVYTLEDIEKFLEAARGSKAPLRDTALIYFLYDTLVRADELCSLTVGEVDLTRRMFEVMGKGKRPRILTFFGETSWALRQYQEQRKAYLTPYRKRRILRQGFNPEDYTISDESPLFASTARPGLNYPLSPDSLLRIIKRLGKAAGIEQKCTTHLFRHSGATDLTRNRAPGSLVQALLGHTTSQMTNRYIHLSGVDVTNQHRQYSPVANLPRNQRRK